MQCLTWIFYYIASNSKLNYLLKLAASVVFRFVVETYLINTSDFGFVRKKKKTDCITKFKKKDVETWHKVGKTEHFKTNTSGQVRMTEDNQKSFMMELNSVFNPFNRNFKFLNLQPWTFIINNQCGGRPILHRKIYEIWATAWYIEYRCKFFMNKDVIRTWKQV